MKRPPRPHRSLPVGSRLRLAVATLPPTTLGATRDFHHRLAVKLHLKPRRKPERSITASSFSQSPATRGPDISGGRRKSGFKRHDLAPRRCLAVCVTIAVIALTGARARAITLEDIVELSQAGIGEVVLIELNQDGRHRVFTHAFPAQSTQGCRCVRPGAAGVAPQWALSGRPPRSPQAQRDESRRTTRSDGCRPRTRAACESVVTSIVLVPTRPARAIGGRQRAPGPQTALGFGGVSGLSSLSTRTTRTTGTATNTGREPVYWGWGGKKRPGSWNGHSETNR